MHLRLLDILCCPGCRAALECSADAKSADGEVIRGTLRCDACRSTYPITRGIPRFVATQQYSGSFGYQWNLFRLEQIDSANRTGLSEKRFYSETGWDDGWMNEKWLLEAGCGAGRFLEVASRSSAEVVGVDLSTAVDGVRETLGSRCNLHLVQASIFDLPFRLQSFDGVYSIGVLQHTPDPAKALGACAAAVKPAGRLAVTVYERRRWTKFYSKYWVRPLTSRMDPRVLLALIRIVMPVLFLVTEVLFRIPLLRRLFQFIIPVANYVDVSELSLAQRYRWAMLDTFDMLAPRYDLPQTEGDLQRVLRDAGLTSIRRLPNAGLNLIAERAVARQAVQV